ncbi:TPA: hypothetical protein WL464_000825 [Neisseria gonorrhoeae]
MPSENLSDGIFAGKSVEDFAPAQAFHTARRIGRISEGRCEMKRCGRRGCRHPAPNRRQSVIAV